MNSVRTGHGSIVRFAIIIGVLAALTCRGALAAPAMRDGDEPWPPAMSAPATQQTLTAFWAMIDRGTSLDQILADDIVLTYSDMGQQFKGRAAVERALDYLYHKAIVGWMTRETLVIGSGWGATSGMFAGTQIDTFEGMSSKGRSMAVPYAAFYTLAKGQIVTIEFDFSRQDILSQLADPPFPSFPTPIRPGEPY